MYTSPTFRRDDDRPAGRRPSARRPGVENLEGRRLLSGIQGNHIRAPAAAIVEHSLVGSVTETGHTETGHTGTGGGSGKVRLFE
jgi:hypothetical protein